ncbi:MAG: hypothetical protein JW760_07075 [Spirochaetales bacterium]|nr:hypothetical protein [Spirochaetales bacterium]
MKQSPQMQRIQQNMRPGVITLEGFLGKDERNLSDILEEDNATVQRLGLSHESIARRMEELKDQGAAGLGEFIEVPPHFEVKVESVRGKLPCPFEHPGIYPKTNITCNNLRTGKSLLYTDMHIHLIGSHGFYEGKGSLYRLEPEDLADILEVE